MEADGLMELLGFTITRAKGLPVPVTDNRGGWFRVFESYPGAWQHNVVVDRNTVLTYHAIYACITLIASDFAKLRVKLMRSSGNDGSIWTETQNPAYSPVLRKPNRFQTRIQFYESWMLSKLIRGNTYVLKERDARNVVTALYVLDPNRVTPMVTDDGTVFYQLRGDNISGIVRDAVVPASEVIHDRWNCLYHPLIGTSPIIACGIAAMQGLSIQNNQTKFFDNQSMPGGVMTAPGKIDEVVAQRMKQQWEENYTGNNAGRIAVLGGGLKFEKVALTSVELQMIDQLKWTSEVACSVFHVPGYKVGIGTVPVNTSVQSLNIEYYSQALQRHIEDAEVCLDEGLGMAPNMGTEFDTDNLMRMDSLTLMQTIKEGVSAGVYAPNEGRAKVGLKAVPGGDTPYLQQQNFSLGALAKRDAQPDPFVRVTEAVAGQTADPTAVPVPEKNPPAEPPPAPAKLDISRIRKTFDGRYDEAA